MTKTAVYTHTHTHNVEKTKLNWKGKIFREKNLIKSNNIEETLKKQKGSGENSKTIGKAKQRWLCK